MSHEDFEIKVIDVLLSGADPELASLRAQHAAARVPSREWTGSGVFVHFDVPNEFPSTKISNFHLGDVEMQLAGAKTPAEAILWMRNGRLSSLEYFVYEGEWPRNPEILTISYFGGERDPDCVQRQLSA